MASKYCSKLVDVTGQRFGKLTVVCKSDKTSPAGALWICKCDCGGETITTSYKLRTGHTLTCGCSRYTDPYRYVHGEANKTRTYKTWKDMRQRCRNPNSDQWEWYGGRGISVCERWDSFVNFLADMGDRPEGMTLDRINPDGNYEPSNCRWATAKEQAETNRGCFKKVNKAN